MSGKWSPQIHEQLQERDDEELTRDDVLAVLARLDPPEAYIPDETEDNVGLLCARRIPYKRLKPQVRSEPGLGVSAASWAWWLSPSCSFSPLVT